MKSLSMLFALMFLVSCASKPLSVGESKVRILHNSDAPVTCTELSRVHAPGLASMTEQGRDEDLKRATYKAGGDTVVVTRRDENNTVYGIAFKCRN